MYASYHRSVGLVSPPRRVRLAAAQPQRLERRTVRVVRWAVDPAACNLTMAASTTDPEESATDPRMVPGAGLVCAAHDCATSRMQIDDVTAAPHPPRDWPRCSCARMN